MFKKTPPIWDFGPFLLHRMCMHRIKMSVQNPTVCVCAVTLCSECDSTVKRRVRRYWDLRKKKLKERKRVNKNKIKQEGSRMKEIKKKSGLWLLSVDQHHCGEQKSLTGSKGMNKCELKI